MQVDSIKVNNDKTIKISYTQITKDNIEGDPEYFKFSVKTNRPAQQKIYDLLAGLKPHANKLLELPKSYIEKLSIKGVNWTYTKDNIMGITMNVDRTLESTDTPTQEETPHHLVEKYDEKSKQKNIMDSEMSKLIYSLMDEISKFISGYKDQIELKLEQ